MAVKKTKSRTVYIPCIEVTDGKRHREQYAQKVDENGKEVALSSSGRWTDGAKYSRREYADKQAKIIAKRYKDSPLAKGEKVKPYVRVVSGVSSDYKTVGQLRKAKKK